MLKRWNFLKTGFYEGIKLGRSLCIGTDGHIWAGTYHDRKYYKLSSADGSLLAGPVTLSSVSPYGCLVDGSGLLWSASLGSYLGEIDTSGAGSVVGEHSHAGYGADYGIALGNGKVYQAARGGGSNTYIEHDPATNTFSKPAAVNISSALGIATDSSGKIFVGKTNGGMYKFNADGSLACSAPSQTGNSEIRGVVVDSSGDVWAVHRTSHNISKFKGSDCTGLGVFPVGRHPYTYSDAAGTAASTVTQPTGFWTLKVDGGAGTEWGTATWNTESEGDVPAGAVLEVRARAADTMAGLDFETYELISSGTEFTLAGGGGRWIQIQVKFQPNASGASPVLSDLSLDSKAPSENTCNGLTATIVGTAGDDTLVGTDGDDVIVGLGGNDTICGNEGFDQLSGGDGDDWISGDEGPDRLYGKDGKDELHGGPGDDVFYGGDDDDEIWGEEDNDRLKGEGGNDTMYGGPGNDSLSGSSGNDTGYGDEGDDRLYGGGDNDELWGGSGKDVFYGGSGDDTMYGEEDKDRLKGDSGTDHCDGGTGGTIPESDTASSSCETTANIP